MLRKNSDVFMVGWEGRNNRPPREKKTYMFVHN